MRIFTRIVPLHHVILRRDNSWFSLFWFGAGLAEYKGWMWMWSTLASWGGSEAKLVDKSSVERGRNMENW
jgi:hypothetical protein